MELLYLWIEDYKNIKRQGFNFSPKYRFDFNHQTNELKCTENKDLPENFFGDNITNVTAIVGKNGSGKSSLLEATHFWLKTLKTDNSIFIFKSKENETNIYFKSLQNDKKIKWQNVKIQFDYKTNKNPSISIINLKNSLRTSIENKENDYPFDYIDISN